MIADFLLLTLRTLAVSLGCLSERDFITLGKVRVKTMVLLSMVFWIYLLYDLFILLVLLAIKFLMS